MTETPPRLFCITATAAPVVAVFRRGPSAWWHVGRWDTDALAWRGGAWFKGRLYPRRSDLSPDGRWLCYTALRPGEWSLADSYIAMSRLPWLAALAAWSTDGTWTRGYHFTGSRRQWQLGAVEHGDAAACRKRYGVAATPALQFAVERRRGWAETADSPPRDPADPFDERRNAELAKPQPGGAMTLEVRSVGVAGGEFGRGGAVDGLRAVYRLRGGGEGDRVLDGVGWADWDRRGRLLLATRDGHLQVWDRAAREQLVDHHLSDLRPDPQPAPAAARRW